MILESSVLESGSGLVSVLSVASAATSLMIVFSVQPVASKQPEISNKVEGDNMRMFNPCCAYEYCVVLFN